ncbi:hypothetical protein UVI_02018210 [Ustilaginoidea virens]|uniref:Zn(2)-C6 fungal-type domain-containing protein n=1 Tax=Ustilaginoidea virens TaxID=1159556 RepID=A0A1B5KS77_USTVR|nr:hypothetical protein UVI_02018210 [Ustilaginoidea virens]
MQRNTTGSSTAAPSQRQGGSATGYPAASPEAYTSPKLAPANPMTPVLNPRSCVTCRRRKVRCDKQKPCSNCRRAQITCIFPAPGRAPRQTRPKDPNAPPKTPGHREAELIQRLKKLEGIVEELSGQIVEPAAKLPTASSTGTGSPENQFGIDGMVQRHMRPSLDPFDPFAGQDASPKEAESSSTQTGAGGGRPKEKQPNFGRMVTDEGRGTCRYVSNGFWSQLNDEDDDATDYEETPSDSLATGLSVASDRHAFILSYRSVDVDLEKYHPLPSHGTFLWSVYQENVEPLVKLMHVPSVDLTLCNARRNCGKLTPGDEALVFTIYFAAITSLEPDDYRFAVEQSLAKANFLDTTDLAVLQAFTLFLIVVRRHGESRFCWALTGLLIRIAQGMGLHRDGTHLKLPPFETEMRRRLWWQILLLDLRSGEELGTDMAVSERFYDTLMPSNINDADIGPESTEAPIPREGKSDMAASLIRTELSGLSRRVVASASAMSSLCPMSDQPSVAERERMLIEVYQRVEDKFLQHVLDETDPLYWVASIIARLIVAKACLMIYQPMLFPGSEVELSEEIRQRVFIAAIEITEYGHKINTDPRCKQYRWLYKTYTNWHAIAFTLIETCRRPWTALVERAWEAITGYDVDPLELAKKSDHAAVFLPLRRLFAKARKHREMEIVRLQANQDEARRLDFAERMNPAQARFGPVPGAENKMDQVREHWWSLMRTTGTSSKPPSTGRPCASKESSSLSRAGNEGKPFVPGLSSSIDLSTAAMEYMDGVMSQPNPNIAELWNFNRLVDNEVNGTGSAAPQAAVPNQLCGQDTAGHQGALAMQTEPPKHDDLTSYLWFNAFTGMSNKTDAWNDEPDMLGHDFNWQDWSQSIRGLEMESTQTGRRWKS